MHEDCLLLGLSVTPACFCISHLARIPSLANEIVITSPLSLRPSCGSAWMEGHIVLGGVGQRERLEEG